MTRADLRQLCVFLTTLADRATIGEKVAASPDGGDAAYLVAARPEALRELLEIVPLLLDATEKGEALSELVCSAEPLGWVCGGDQDGAQAWEKRAEATLREHGEALARLEEKLRDEAKRRNGP